MTLPAIVESTSTSKESATSSPTYWQPSLFEFLIVETPNGFGSSPLGTDPRGSVDMPPVDLGVCTFAGCDQPAVALLRFIPRPETRLRPPRPAPYCDTCGGRVARLFHIEIVDEGEWEAELEHELLSASGESRSCIALRVDGSPCRRTAVAGLDVCPTHGGRSTNPRTIEETQRRRQRRAAGRRLNDLLQTEGGEANRPRPSSPAYSSTTLDS